MTRNLITVAILIFTLFGCSTEQNNSKGEPEVFNNPEYGTLQDLENPPFEFELVRTIKVELPEDFILTDFDELITDQDGNFYFMDQKQFKLISIDRDGNFRWMTGKKGRGPGDFEEAKSMVTDGKNLYIGNLDGARLDIFDFDRNFLKSHNLEKDVSFGNFIGFSSEGQLVGTTPSWENWDLNIFVLDIYEDSVSLNREFNINQSKGLKTNRRMATYTSVKIHNDVIFSGSLLDYSYEEYDLTGKLLKKVTRDYDTIVRPGMASVGESESLRIFGGTSAPLTLSGKYRIMHAYWPVNVTDPDQFVKRSMTGSVPKVEYRHSRDVFTLEGELLFSFENDGNLPEMGSIDHIDHIDHNNSIYTSTVTPEAIIHEYKLNRITTNK